MHTHNQAHTHSHTWRCAIDDGTCRAATANISLACGLDTMSRGCDRKANYCNNKNEKMHMRSLEQERGHGGRSDENSLVI
eukprot:6203794-Pleurochrysis_carterae.AAC.1